MVITNEIASDSQKLRLLFSSTGNTIKKTSEGITSQKIPLDNEAICAVSLVSIYSQMMANSETSGMEANILPIKVLRLDISETATSTMDESSTLTMV
jgi:hypothetical protein